MEFDDENNKDNSLSSLSNNLNSKEQIESSNTESVVIAEALFQEKELKTIVHEQKYKDQLRNKGFGEVFNDEYILSDLEALYLLNNKKLKLLGKDEYDFSTLMRQLL